MRALACATALAALMWAAGGHAQPASLAAGAASARDAALAGSGAYAIVESLTTEIGPRPAGSPAMERARDWGVAKLKALGFVNVHAEPFTIWAWFKGVETAEVTAPYPQPLVITGLGGSVATPLGGIEGEAVVFKTYAALLAAPVGALTGKIAVMTEHMPDAAAYGFANGWRRRGPSEAAKRGAVGFLIRSLATDNLRRPHAGAMNYDEAQPKIPAAALSGPDADQLERIAARGLAPRVKFTLLPTYVPQATTWNVVGEIRGSAKPDEIVLVGGHLDSWGLGTGAIDDGAGVAITTAAARLVGALKPRRTIRVVMFGAEETGQAGPAYAKAHAAEAARIVMAGEADFGAERVLAFQIPQGAVGHPAMTALTEVLAPLGTAFNPEPAKFGGDDIAGLYQLGVPVVQLRQDGAHYFDLHHSADDTLDKITPSELDKAAAAWAATLYVAAQSDIDFRPPPKP